MRDQPTHRDDVLTGSRPPGSGGPWSSPDNNGHVSDLTALYALGVLEPEERDLVDLHVLVCPPCATALEDDQRTAGLLPFLSPPAAPAPDVKAALFARIAHSQQQSSAGHRLERRHAPARAADAARPEPATAVKSTRWRRPSLRHDGHHRRWRSFAVPLMAVPLVLALTATGIWGMRLRGQVDSRDQQLAELSAQIANPVGAVVGDDAIQYELVSDDGPVTATGTMFVDEEAQAIWLSFQVDDPTPNRSYDIYVNRNGSVVPAGEVTVDEQGRGRQMIPLEGSFANYKAVQVEARPLIGDDMIGQPDVDTGDSVLTYRQQLESGAATTDPEAETEAPSIADPDIDSMP